MPRTVISPIEKLKKRIEKEFKTKKLIGDIAINDEEFEILMEIFRNQYVLIRRSSSHMILKDSFCVALVQIGIRYYDGNYWNHVKECLGVNKLDGNTQRWIGQSFLKSLKKYGKLNLESTDYVNNILVHAVLSNHYAPNFFDYLFDFYRIDLERDITRLDRQTMNELVDAVQRNDNTARTYNVRQHTADATKLNRLGMKNRYRRYLKLIDKAFMGERLPERSANRIVCSLLNWLETSNRFNEERRQYAGNRSHGRKSFSSPYINYQPKTGKFALVIPPQLIKPDDAEDLYWEISIGSKTQTIETNPYQQGITGYKTEEEEVDLLDEEILQGMVICLAHQEETVRRFTISAERIRFFDADGDSVHKDTLHEGRYDAFTAVDFKPSSDAIHAQEKWDTVLHTCFEFETGDIVVFPDGKPLCVGQKMTEGLMPRNLVEKTVAFLSSEEKAPVYHVAPVVLVKMFPSRRAGTLLYVNDQQYRIREEDVPTGAVIPFDLKDRSGETAYLIHLKDFGVASTGIYEVRIDVPNDGSFRTWKFAYIPGLSFYFEAKPYIFQNVGTLCLPEDFHARAPGTRMAVNGGITSLFFDIQPGEEYFHFSIDEIDIGAEIPALSYCFDGEPWQSMPHMDIWHVDFKPMLFIKCDAEKLNVILETNNADDFEGEHIIPVIKNHAENIFKCDLNPFRSWLNHDTGMCRIMLRIPDMEQDIPLAGIITRSFLVSGILFEEPNNSEILGEFDIIGYSDYFVDLYYNGELLLEKEPLTNGKFQRRIKLHSGKYEAVVFELEGDDTGFGEGIYYEIGRQEVQLLSPADLAGKDLQISYIYPLASSNEQLPDNDNVHYSIADLKHASDDDIHNYTGYMYYEDRNGRSVYYHDPFMVNVCFPDLGNIQECVLTAFDEYGDLQPFIYDSKNHMIVVKENDNIRKAEKYRRYSPVLYEEEYVYHVEFTETAHGIAIRSKQETPAVMNADEVEESKEVVSEDTGLSKLGLDKTICEYLEDEELGTVGALGKFLNERGTSGLHDIAHLNGDMRNKIILFAMQNKII